jgi:hypothetical protein
MFFLHSKFLDPSNVLKPTINTIAQILKEQNIDYTKPQFFLIEGKCVDIKKGPIIYMVITQKK